MALIKCPECGKELSSDAKVCPSCGKQFYQKWYKKWWIWLIVGMIVFIAVMVTIVFVEYNKGAQEYRQSDSYYELQEIIDDSKRASSKSQSTLEELEGIQD